MATEGVLLPTNVKPTWYDITLDVDLEETFLFHGHETIHIHIISPTTSITLHSIQLRILSVSLLLPSLPAETSPHQHHLIIPSRIVHQEEQQRVVFMFDQLLEPGEGDLKIEFEGELNDSLCGFYRSKYMLDGKERYMATTQFEATDARRSFPCWDEPAIKATFRVTLIVPKDRTVVSNMPEVKREDVGNDRVSVQFDWSPIMSTYLLAFIIGDFDFVQSFSKTPTKAVRIRVYTPKGKAEQGRFPLQIATDSLAFYSEEFGIEYPLPKLDLLAIPDFAAGAMENWGAITYREARLLFDSKNSTTSMTQANVRTINHELAHMWFGNLVTMQWWTHLWLNEGFARYMEHVATDKFFPKLQIWTQFVSTVQAAALKLDSLRSSHPIEVDVNHTDEINSIFDSISYAKGASVLRMLVDYIGESSWKTAIHNYLVKYQYRNAVTDDLWAEVSAVLSNNDDVADIMRTWTRAIGYPLVTLSHDSTSLSQIRFLTEELRENEREQLWKIPISLTLYQYEGTSEKGKVYAKKIQKFLLTQREQKIPDFNSNFNPNHDFIKINNSRKGLYRVNYSREQWEKLGEAVEANVFDEVDRLSLLDDVLALAEAGILSVSQLLSMLLRYRNETDYCVFSVFAKSLQQIFKLVEGQEFKPLYCNFVKHSLKALARSHSPRIVSDLTVNPENDDSLLTLLRSELFWLLGKANDEEIIKEAFALFESQSPIPPDLRSPTYHLVVINGGVQEYEKVLNLYQQSDFAEDKRTFLSALGRAPTTELVERTLKFALSTQVRAQDLPLIVSSIAVNPVGRELSRNWLFNNWTNLITQVGTGQNFVLSGIISGVVSPIVKQEHLDEVCHFFEINPVRSVGTSLKQSVEHATATIKWIERDRDALKMWLEQQPWLS